MALPQNLGALEQEARAMFRTVGPRVSAADNLQDDTRFRYCRICNPPEKTYTCPVCDYGTDTQWAFRMHLKFNPQWCQERGRRKARKWASKV